MEQCYRTDNNSIYIVIASLSPSFISRLLNTNTQCKIWATQIGSISFQYRIISCCQLTCRKLLTQPLLLAVLFLLDLLDELQQELQQQAAGNLNFLEEDMTLLTGQIRQQEVDKVTHRVGLDKVILKEQIQEEEDKVNLRVRLQLEVDTANLTERILEEADTVILLELLEKHQVVAGMATLEGHHIVLPEGKVHLGMLPFLAVVYIVDVHHNS